MTATDPIQPRTARAAILPIAAMAAALFAFAPFASAAPGPVASGTATLTLGGGFAKALKGAGIKISKLGPATVRGGTVALPVGGGSLDLATGLGSVSLGGGFQLVSGKSRATIEGLALDTTTELLTADVAGKTLKLATIAPATPSRNGFGVALSIKALKLTGSAAQQLNRKLGGARSTRRARRAPAAASRAAAMPFRAGQLLGATSVEALPSSVAILPAGQATLALSLPFETTARAVKALPKPLAPAELLSPGPPSVFVSPIAGESIALDASAGILQTGGGLTLANHGKLKDTEITLGALSVNLGAKVVTADVTVALSGFFPQPTTTSLGRMPIADISLAGATVTTDPALRTVAVQNATATLNATSAGLLNQDLVEPFEVEKETQAQHFAAGDPLGTLSFTAQTQ